MTDLDGRNVRFVGDRNVSHWGVAESWPPWRVDDSEWAEGREAGDYRIRWLAEGEAPTLCSRDQHEYMKAAALNGVLKVFVVKGEGSAILRILFVNPSKEFRKQAAEKRDGGKVRASSMLLLDPSSTTFNRHHLIAKEDRDSLARGGVLDVKDHRDCLICRMPFSEFSVTLRANYWGAGSEEPGMVRPVAGFVHPGCHDHMTQVDGITAYFDRGLQEDLRVKALLKSVSVASVMYFNYCVNGRVDHMVSTMNLPDGSSSFFSETRDGWDFWEEWSDKWGDAIYGPVVERMLVSEWELGARLSVTTDKPLALPDGFAELAKDYKPKVDKDKWTGSLPKIDMDKFTEHAEKCRKERREGICGECGGKFLIGDLLWENNLGALYHFDKEEHPGCVDSLKSRDSKDLGLAVSYKELKCFPGTEEEWLGADKGERIRAVATASVVVVVRMHDVMEKAVKGSGKEERLSLDRVIELRNENVRILSSGRMPINFGLCQGAKDFPGLLEDEGYEVFDATCSMLEPWICGKCGHWCMVEEEEGLGAPGSKMPSPNEWICHECLGGLGEEDLPGSYVGKSVRLLDNDYLGTFEPNPETAPPNGYDTPVGSVGIVYEADRALIPKDGDPNSVSSRSGPFTGVLMVAFPKLEETPFPPRLMGENLWGLLDDPDEDWIVPLGDISYGLLLLPDQFEPLEDDCSNSGGCWGNYVCPRHARSVRPVLPLSVEDPPDDPFDLLPTVHEGENTGVLRDGLLPGLSRLLPKNGGRLKS